MSDQEMNIKGSILDRVKAESEQHCPICQQVMWLSFYFFDEDKAKETAAETVSDAWSRSKGIRNRSLPRRAIWTAGEVWDEGKESVGRRGR